jgi:uncharacterized protein (DUF924 family)
MESGILEFWFGDGLDAASVAAARSALWWGKSAESDEAIRRRFGDWVDRAASGELDGWLVTPRGRLALIILLDQFRRNIHRGTPAAFAADGRALQWAKEGIAGGIDDELRPIERVFFYLPLEHSEQLADQRQCVQLYKQLLDEVAPAEKPLFATYLDFAERHREIIERFGRFPHRNAILGRVSTEEELAFLEIPGSSF